MRNRVLRSSLLILIALALVGATVPADAYCWDCYERYIGGGALGLEEYFYWCGPSESGDDFDCYFDGEQCYVWGVCIDYIAV